MQRFDSRPSAILVYVVAIACVMMLWPGALFGTITSCLAVHFLLVLACSESVRCHSFQGLISVPLFHEWTSAPTSQATWSKLWFFEPSPLWTKRISPCHHDVPLHDCMAIEVANGCIIVSIALHFVCIMRNNYTKSATWVAGSLTDTKAGHAHETFSSLERKACPLILRSFGTLPSESISDSCDTFGFGIKGSFLGSCSFAWAIWASATEVKGLFLGARCAEQKRIASVQFIESHILNGYRTATFNSFLWYDINVKCTMLYG